MAINVDSKRPGEREDGEKGTRSHWFSGETHGGVDDNHYEHSASDIQEDSKHSEQTGKKHHQELIPVAREREREGEREGRTSPKQSLQVHHHCHTTNVL